MNNWLFIIKRSENYNDKEENDKLSAYYRNDYLICTQIHNTITVCSILFIVIERGVITHKMAGKRAEMPTLCKNRGFACEDDLMLLWLRSDILISTQIIEHFFFQLPPWIKTSI